MRTGSMIAVAIVLAMVGASFGVLLGNVSADQGSPDSFGYVYTDSKATWPSIGYDWVDIGGTGTWTGTSGDDGVAGPLPIGFDFMFYGNRYSAFNVTTNGYIMFGTASSDWGNDGIPNTNTPNNIIAAYWDDLYADYGEIVYETVGTSPNRQLVVEFMDVTLLGGGSLMTFEIVLNEGMNDIWVNYQTMGTNTGTGATEGIENSDGTIGVQYGAWSSVITGALSIRYSVPDVLIGPSQSLLAARGSTVDYALTASNLQAISDVLSITVASDLGWTVTLFDGTMNPLTDTDGDLVLDTGTLASMESKDIIVQVAAPADATEYPEHTFVTATSVTDTGRYFTCKLTTDLNPMAYFNYFYSDWVVDEDSDGAYDYLNVMVGIDAEVEADFLVMGILGDSLIPSQNMTHLLVGFNYVNLTFPGWPIYASGYGGPWTITLTIMYGSVQQDFWQTGTGGYWYGNFEGPSGWIEAPHTDAWIDLDVDGYGDYLLVTVGVNVAEAGVYEVRGTLYDPGWGWVEVITNRTPLIAGLNAVEFWFSGWRIYQTYDTGNFHVELYLYDSNMRYMDYEGYTTNYWYYYDFEYNTAAWFDYPHTAMVESDDADPEYERLVANVNIVVEIPGTYVLVGQLYDDWGTWICEKSLVLELDSGGQIVPLSFPSYLIYEFAISSYFYIELTLLDRGMSTLDWSSFYTEYYNRDSFDPTPPRIDSVWTDAAAAVDGIVGATEWAAATVVDLSAAMPRIDLDAEMRVMNDAETLYILIDARGDTVAGWGDYASIAFDTDNDNTAANGHEDQFFIQSPPVGDPWHSVYSSGSWIYHCDASGHEGLYAMMGFGPSSTEAEDHRVYEIAIPLELLNATQGGTLGFLAASDSNRGVYDSDSGTYIEWPTFTNWNQQLGQYADLRLASQPGPPVTSAVVAGTAGLDGWYKSATTVTLSATGGWGGCDHTEWALEDAAFQTYTAPFAVTGDGTHSLKFRSCDEHAQVEATRTLAVKIDTVAPVSSGIEDGAEVYLSATDATSLVGSIMYRVDGGAWTASNGTIVFTEAGTYLVEFYAVDLAGNEEAAHSLTVKVEKKDLPGYEPLASSILLIGLAVIAVVVVLLIVFLLLKRKKGQQPVNMMPPPPQA